MIILTPDDDYEEWSIVTPDYNANFVDDIKRLPVGERSWNPEEKCWTVSDRHKDDVIVIAKRYWPDAQVRING